MAAASESSRVFQTSSVRGEDCAKVAGPQLGFHSVYFSLHVFSAHFFQILRLRHAVSFRLSLMPVRALILGAVPLLHTIIWRLFRDDHVVHVALAQPRLIHADEAAVFLDLLYCARAHSTL